MTFHPPVNKDIGHKFALVSYRSVKDAICAKNCLHRTILDSSGAHLLNIGYEPVLQTSKIRKWIVDHPRVALPALAGFILGLSYAIFDPIRVFFIQNTLTQRFSLSSGLSRWIPLQANTWMSSTWDQLKNTWTHQQSEPGIISTSDLAGREEMKQRIAKWLKEPPSNVLLMVGPRGYGKERLIDSLLQDRPLKLHIRCDDILNRPESEQPARLAQQVGYFPMFASLVWFANFMDTLFSAATGQKSGLSTSTGNELRRILDMTGLAITELVEQQRKSQPFMPNSDKNMDYPVVVIYLSDTMGTGQLRQAGPGGVDQSVVFVEQILTWASLLAETTTAHVIVVTRSDGFGSGSSTSSSSAILDRVSTWFHQYRRAELVTFKEASDHDTRQFLRTRLPAQFEDERVLDSVMELLGGRLTDLEVFLDKVKAGLTVGEALEEMILAAIAEVRRDGLLSNYNSTSTDAPDQKRAPWTPVQFWYVMKSICGAGQQAVSFNKIKYSPVFGGDDRPLYAMERAEYIAIDHDFSSETASDSTIASSLSSLGAGQQHGSIGGMGASVTGLVGSGAALGHPLRIQTSRRLYCVAFSRLAKHTPTRSAMDVELYKWLIEKEGKKVEAWEKEIQALVGVLQEAKLVSQVPLTNGGGGRIWGSSKASDVDPQEALARRFKYLAAQIVASQEKIDQWTVQMKQSQDQM